MRHVIILRVFIVAGPAFAGQIDLDTEISKLEFQGVHFGEFGGHHT